MKEMREIIEKKMIKEIIEKKKDKEMRWRGANKWEFGGLREEIKGNKKKKKQTKKEREENG